MKQKIARLIFNFGMAVMIGGALFVFIGLFYDAPAVALFIIGLVVFVFAVNWAADNMD